MHSPELENMNREIKKPFRVAILVRQFPNIVQTYILNHIVSLRNSGADTLIIAESNPKQAETHPAIKEYNLISDTVYINTDGAHILKQIFTAPLYKPRYLSAIKKIIFSGLWKQYGFKYGIKAVLSAKSLTVREFNIIHSHTLFSSYEYLYLKNVFNIPMITTFHGLEPRNSKPLSTEKISIVLEKVNAFIVNTRFARKQLADMGCEKNKIHIIPQGTNTDDFPFISRSISTEEDITILSVGRLSIEKGFHVAIRSISELIKKYPTIKYHIVGGGPEENSLKKQITELGLQDTVKIFGTITTEKLLAHYSTALIFILPSIDLRDGSHTETQGVVLQEAQSSGLPVIASRTGGIPEVIHDGKTGLLFDENNEQQLTDHIVSLISDQNRYHTISMKGRKDVEDNYSTEAICRRQLNVYRSILAKPPLGH